MESPFIAHKTFDKSDFTINGLPKGEYEDCVFTNCNFSNASLAGIEFTACVFIACNLSLCQLSQTALRDVHFKDCKMLGLCFGCCNPFGLTCHFENCSLHHASFFQTKIKKTVFKNTALQEVDFTECDLRGSIFDNCDFTGATFENTIAEKVDFRTSFNYAIDPEINRIKKAKFSLVGLMGLLGKYDIEIE